jgi:hypothetical protein
MKYIRVTEDGFQKARLVPETDNLFDIVSKNRDVPWYYSTYKFNEEHKKKFDETHSVAGIRDVTTNAVWFDFDAKDIENARKTTITLVERLLADGFEEDCIKINYSGNKGFHVSIDVEQELTPNQVEAIAHKYAGDLEGFDESMYDATQVLRIPLTKHEKSGVYCTPITYDDLKDNNALELKEIASDISEFDVDSYLDFYQVKELSDELITTTKPEPDVTTSIKKELSFDTSDIDMKNKPRYIDEPRWLLMNGFFRGSGTADVGERNYAFLCLASTYKNLGYDREIVLGMLNGVAELQAMRTGEEPFDEHKIKARVDDVFSDSWLGGQFTTRDPNNWLYKYAIKMGVERNEEETAPKTISEIKEGFAQFVKNIDKNTVKTGIEVLDKAMPITIGMNLGVVGAASSGKTAFALEVLRNTSRTGVVSVFASLDMHRNRLYEKLLYKVSGLDREELYHKIKMGEAGDIEAKIKEDYGNVYFYDRSGATVEDVRQYVKEVERSSGEKVKMVMLDYFERVSSDVTDATASSLKVCNAIQDMINDLDLAVITLVQPNKMSLGGGPDKPILSYTAIKGSSFLYQSFRSILSLWRPFFTPQYVEHDNYMQMAILKNDLGELGMFDFNWNGKKGEITPMEDVERQHLKELIKMKENIENGDKGSDGWD